jgi:hypothetical protein
MCSHCGHNDRRLMPRGLVALLAALAKQPAAFGLVQPLEMTGFAWLQAFALVPQLSWYAFEVVWHRMDDIAAV